MARTVLDLEGGVKRESRKRKLGIVLIQSKISVPKLLWYHPSKINKGSTAGIVLNLEVPVE